MVRFSYALEGAGSYEIRVEDEIVTLDLRPTGSLDTFTEENGGWFAFPAGASKVMIAVRGGGSLFTLGGFLLKSVTLLPEGWKEGTPTNSATSSN